MKIVYLFFLVWILPFFVNILHAEENERQLSTHMLDTNRGEPAAEVMVVLFKWSEESYGWEVINRGMTAGNGRIDNFLPDEENKEGTYKLLFETGSYFEKQGISTIFPFVEIIFSIDDKSHYHIPLTMSANGYSTYRGS